MRQTTRGRVEGIVTGQDDMGEEQPVSETVLQSLSKCDPQLTTNGRINPPWRISQTTHPQNRPYYTSSLCRYSPLCPATRGPISCAICFKAQYHRARTDYFTFLHKLPNCKRITIAPGQNYVPSLKHWNLRTICHLDTRPDFTTLYRATLSAENYFIFYRIILAQLLTRTEYLW